MTTAPSPPPVPSSSSPSPPPPPPLPLSLIDGPVLPVVVLEDGADPGDAVAAARALVAGGLRAVEITLRTPGALAALRRVAAEVPEAVVGAGTVLDAGQVAAAADAGARFLVSPGCTGRLLEAARASAVPFLPGVSTASEAMALLERGVTQMKFFPARAAGGPAYLASLASPLPAVRFCPTGGIAPDTAGAYLDLPNVACVGGSWMLPSEAVRARDWARVERLAREAARLDGPRRRPAEGDVSAGGRCR
ncbi:bifunctional 4-hydroxy-2-oxoglutarate aldolase/2-dehydro-3-deoxy-phosphogluconate aldolase [Streptomyces sp. TRM43335]|uniref:2-dehydro-3-deoxy-phosphogluconate aldolase n=1 Tax=Streptomyces taklimakanensis TaxID=2569853 RepID=A0A6G2BA98_9ACTN|nr:bifunctional 4-hydroxy-2-oxoglutarate aldolase/2-dehydro-3-deoxy-phosphogluconate aldolase [Streptomyces taklimakanensis]MTE18822.1 bifunctional 4-hydroxy-2-oxoglutarate aldolase/2-dehydro-3-deoxy-phosphogluconate aldolase [Streptomyces taklimakanensis]